MQEHNVEERKPVSRYRGKSAFLEMPFIHRLKSFMKEAVNILQNHPIFQINVYFAHSALSVLMLAFTGSLAFSILIWYPAILGSYFIV